MARRRFPTVFQRVRLHYDSAGREESYLTRIEDFDEDTITFGTPTARVPLPKPGTTIHGIAFGEDGLYSFIVTVREIGSLGHFPVIVTNRPHAPRRLQRRNYFRVNVALNVNYRMLADENQESTEPFRQAVSRDISGAGILLVIDRAAGSGKWVEMEIPLSDNVITVVGRIVRSNVSKRRDDKMEIGVEFVRIDEMDREKIIKFAFNIQRSQAYDGLV